MKTHSVAANSAVLIRIVALASLVSLFGARAGRADDVAPLLSLDNAIDIADRSNHAVAGTANSIREAEERSAALSTRRLPGLHVDAVGGRFLNSFNVTIPTGSLGAAPSLGAIPPRDSTLSVPADWGALATVTASQPLTQQYRVGLGLEAARLDQQIAGQDLRKERQRVVAEVRKTYYQISATEAGIAALRDVVRAVEELDTVTTRYLDEQMVLGSDAIEVKARLARERQRLAAAEHGLATEREQLNQLLGRDVTAPFRVASPSELTSSASILTLEAARERARASRPEVRSAALRTAQAANARRIVLSGWIPDVSLVASYTRLVNFESLPNDAAAVGVSFNWEPFDWGRKSHEAAERGYTTERAREGLEESQQQIMVEVGERWRAVQDTAALLAATRLEADASAASLESDRHRYRENAAILRDVLRTEARLSAARHDYTDALAGYWSAAAELERTIGDES